MKRILHIAVKTEWEQAQDCGLYKADSLITQGFIHCSTDTQVIRVANFLFKGRRDLVLLDINEEKLKANVKYEGESDNLFPHIYGPLNTDAIECVYPFESDKSGEFSLPSALRLEI